MHSPAKLDFIVPEKSLPSPTCTPLTNHMKEGWGVPLAEAVRENCAPFLNSASVGETVNWGAGRELEFVLDSRRFAV